MAVYVDELRETAWRYRESCHMVADTEQELHEFAALIGMRREWYQRGHYDLTKSRRALAVKLGAVEITRRAAVEFRKMLSPRGARLLPEGENA